MFLSQLMLVAGGLTTVVFAISLFFPIPQDRPINGC